MSLNRITEEVRRDIVDSLLLNGRSISGDLDLISFLNRIWDLSSMRSTDSRFSTAEGDIWQHMIGFTDWTDSFLLFDYLDILTCSDAIFAKFLVTYLHPLAIRSNEEREGIADEMNNFLDNDDFKLESSRDKRGMLLFKFQDKLGNELKPFTYEIVLSFAGEQREYVTEIASRLKEYSIPVFLDSFEEADIWGKNLVEYFQKIYFGEGRYCVMFISSEYKEKLWTTHERRSALDRAIRERSEYILPVRFDETEIPGLSPSIGYQDATKKTPEQIFELIVKKLGRNLS